MFIALWAQANCIGTQHFYGKKITHQKPECTNCDFYQPPSQPTASAKTPDLTQLPSIAINSLHIHHLAFINPTTNTNALNDYAFSGDLNLLWGDTLLAVNAQLNNQQGETIARVSTQAINPTQWNISADINEPAGGSLGKRLALPAEQPCRLKRKST